MYNVYCFLYTVYCILCTVYWYYDSVLITIYRMGGAERPGAGAEGWIHFTVHCEYTRYNVQLFSLIYFVQFPMHHVKYTMQSEQTIIHCMYLFKC